MIGRIWMNRALAILMLAAMLLGCSTTGESGSDAGVPDSDSPEQSVSKSRWTFDYRHVEESAYNSGINFRLLQIKKPRRNENKAEGFIDYRAEVSPAGKRGKTKFKLDQIARYIKTLEDGSKNRRVTTVLLDRPSEDRTQWTFHLELTERIAMDEGVRGGGTVHPLASVLPAWNVVFDKVNNGKEAIGIFHLTYLDIGMLGSSPEVILSGEIESGAALSNLIRALMEGVLFDQVEYPDIEAGVDGMFRFNKLKFTVKTAP